LSASPAPGTTPRLWPTSPSRLGSRREPPYLYFESKQALFIVLREQWDCGLANRMNAEVAALPEAERRSPRRVLRAAAATVAGHVLEEQLENLIAAGIAAGEWPAGTDPALAARLFTSGPYGLMAQWHLAPGSFSWEAAPVVLAGGPAPGEGDGASSPGRSS
jgi:AcrR family transcriptional regulator